MDQVWPSLDVVVAPSRTTARWIETMPRAALDAMAHGIAVVGSAVGAIPETLGDGGIVVPEEDVAALDLPLIYLGGVNRLDTIQAVLDEGFELVAMGRALLREPDLVRTFETQKRAEGLCVHCNKCMPTIYSGTRCVLND